MFAAAKEAGLYDAALVLASRTLGAGLLALHLVQGYGHEITGADVCAAYDSTLKAAAQNGSADDTRGRIKKLVAGDSTGRFVAGILGRQLGLPSA